MPQNPTKVDWGGVQGGTNAWDFPAWRHAAEHAAGRSADIPVLTAARSIFDALWETGLGSENISAAFKAYQLKLGAATQCMLSAAF